MISLRAALEILGWLAASGAGCSSAFGWGVWILGAGAGAPYCAAAGLANRTPLEASNIARPVGFSFIPVSCCAGIGSPVRRQMAWGTGSAIDAKPGREKRQ